ncbi:MAG: DUF4416 family protein [bacterium]
MTGVLFNTDDSLATIVDELSESFGTIRMTGTPYRFDQTDYYEDEMGESLSRVWVVFEELVDQEDLVRHKKTTMELEDQFADSSGNRRYNIDPGHVTGARFVLASRKNHCQRIYLGDGVYAEVTLYFEEGEWKTFPKTYPDLQEPEQHNWLMKARDHWLAQCT